jgi:chemotaxis family two-component system sensor histidine kinase/response regulator PixL
MKMYTTHGAPQSLSHGPMARARRGPAVNPARPDTMELWSDSADVLVVDDDAELRGSLIEALQLAGYYAVGAADGAEAERLARVHGPRLILLDLQMPIMTGWELLERRRENEQLARIPVVVTTAEHSGVPVSEATAILEKPLDEEELLRVVGDILRPAARATGA